MPIINVTVTGRPDPDLSARIAAEVSDLTQAYLRKDPTVTAVAVGYVDPQHWFAGGKSIASQETNSFWLDIKVVDGTNTKQEMAAYIEAIYGAFGKLLGKVHPESYVLVHEVSAAAYGYGGKTQEFRFISGKLQSAVSRV
ncbi:tautomerase family protein [Sinorhizobium terangae]|uniref:4-oxalocrotonate tautomerase n=1 Tax=Sinorhizobium terangae TaxID=110322 RepID=A0A6N7LHG4_SINTE|nr:tautomerase family protein [Sinorhizobium terangae]MBB4188145.1 4-oxalocrotonate tautomerase [Sinorhizobium terangae]MQX16194.1 4-oxalocrotonate tautomerase [Sinorhizobium terangae]WFU49410.1 tautomerase family protein [Sinorhizobium terangae]